MLQTCTRGVKNVCARVWLILMKRWKEWRTEDDEEDVMILRSFFLFVLSMLVSCCCFFYYILNVFQRQIVFVFKNITQQFHLYMIYTLRVTVFLFGLIELDKNINVFRSMWPSASRIINKRDDTKQVNKPFLRKYFPEIARRKITCCNNCKVVVYRKLYVI